MLTMATRDRQELTSGLLRVLLASQRLTRHVLDSEVQVVDSWAGRMTLDELNHVAGWDGNRPFRSVQLALRTTTESASQHGLALFEMSRSSRGLSVPLATVARGCVEALERVHWLLGSSSMVQLVARTASLEYHDMEYPAKYGQKLRRLPLETEPTSSVDEHRAHLKQWLDDRGIPLVKRGQSALAADVLDGSYDDGRLIYSDLSAAAHGHGWATANLYDFGRTQLRRDDTQLISYCMYVIETTRGVATQLVSTAGWN